MSTIRRLYEHPLNTEVHGTKVIQRCCDGNVPYWDTYRIHNDEDAWDDADRNMTVYKQSDPLLVEDATGASDGNVNVPEYDANGRQTGSNDLYPGMVRVEGPNSGYRPDFLTTEQWMDWQGVEWSPNPNAPKNLPNPPRWRRTRIRNDKMRWGKGIRGWGGNDWVFLWCQKCETALESAWSNTLDALPMIAKGVAAVVSYVPVFGTAVAFAINGGVALAQGKPLDEAMLEAVGGSLPGQPVSGMAFSVGVGIAQGKRIDEIAIGALPIPEEMKTVLSVAADIVYGLATGEHITQIMYDEIIGKLPPEAHQAMAMAKRIANGEHIPSVVLTEAERLIVQRVREEAARILEEARNKGEAAFAAAKARAEAVINQYAAETGYQIALMKLPTWQRDAVTTGLVVGAMRGQFVGTFGTVAENPAAKATNDSYYAKGLAIVNAGARYKGVRIHDMLTSQPFRLAVSQPDPLTGAWRDVLQSYLHSPPGPLASGEFKVDDAFRRGFLIATGVCDGKTDRGPGQTAVYQTLAEAGGRAGFDAGQAVAYYRSLYGDGIEAIASTVAQSTARKNTTDSVVSAFGPKAVVIPASTATIKAGLPTLANLQAAIAPPRVEPIVMDEKVYAQKTADRGRWVSYYKSLP